MGDEAQPPAPVSAGPQPRAVSGSLPRPLASLQSRGHQIHILCQPAHPVRPAVGQQL